MAVDLTYGVQVTSVETLDVNVPAASASDKTVTHSGFNSSQSLNASTVVPVTKCAYLEKALSSGAGTIDLTAVTGTGGMTVDMTGLKVQVLKIKNKTTNANPITIAKGATNGWTGFGSAWTVTLAVGQEVTFFGNDATPDVSSTVKVLDLSGTGSQVLEVAIVAG